METLKVSDYLHSHRKSLCLMAASLVALSACAPSANPTPTQTITERLAANPEQVAALSLLKNSTVEIIPSNTTPIIPFVIDKGFCTGNVISSANSDRFPYIKIIDILTANHCLPQPCSNVIDCNLKLTVNQSHDPNKKSDSVPFMAYTFSSHTTKDMAVLSLVISDKTKATLTPLPHLPTQGKKLTDNQKLYALPLGRFQQGIRGEKLALFGSDPNYLAYGTTAIQENNPAKKICDREFKQVFESNFFAKNQFKLNQDMFFFVADPNSPFLLEGASGASLVDLSGNIYGIITHGVRYLETGADNVERGNTCDLAFIPDGIEKLQATNREKIKKLLIGLK